MLFNSLSLKPYGLFYKDFICKDSEMEYVFDSDEEIPKEQVK